MARRKVRPGILRREKIVIDGKEIEVDTFDARVVLGSGKEFESIEELLNRRRNRKSNPSCIKGSKNHRPKISR